MLSEYEAWVITHCRIKDVDPPYRSRRVAGPAAIVGLVLVGTLVLWAYIWAASIVTLEVLRVDCGETESATGSAVAGLRAN